MCLLGRISLVRRSEVGRAVRRSSIRFSVFNYSVIRCVGGVGLGAKYAQISLPVFHKSAVRCVCVCIGGGGRVLDSNLQDGPSMGSMESGTMTFISSEFEGTRGTKTLTIGNYEHKKTFIFLFLGEQIFS